MDIKFSILLYSKYSSNSTKIIDIINQNTTTFTNNFINKYTTTFTNNFDFKLVCIDNEKVRNQVLNSKNIKITKVPCILILYNDGGLEKYEGDDAFNWVESIIGQIQPVKQPHVQPLQQQAVQPTVQQNVQQTLVQPEQQDVDNRKYKQKNVKKNKSVSKSNVTSIDDLDDLDELEELNIDDTIIDDDNNNDIENDVINNAKNNNGEKKDKSALNIKRNDLMSMATMMQKSREEFVEKNEKRKKY